MRICDPSIFPLTLEIQHSQGLPEDCEFTARDSQSRPLWATCNRTRDTTKIAVEVNLPVKMVLEIRSHGHVHQLDLMALNLAGISVKKDKLLHCLEYRHDSRDKPDSQWTDLLAQKTLTWMTPCFVIVDLFDTNPFAWHLYIGNKIQF